MDVMETGTQEVTEEQPQAESTESTAQDVPQTSPESQEEATEERPEISIDGEGNLEISDDALEYEGSEYDTEEPKAEQKPEEVAEQAQPETYTVKVNGEEVQVTLDELLNGYSRTKDYTQKTMQVAEDRKELEAQKAEVAEQLKQLDLQSRYGVNITPDVQKQISIKADEYLRQQYGKDVDEYSREYQDARNMVVNTLTSQYSQQIKASQRLNKAAEYLRQREPHYDQINALSLQIAKKEKTGEELEKLAHAKAVGDPAPLLEMFDVARQRFYQQMQPQTAPQATPQPQPSMPMQPPQPQQKKITPEPPRVESASGGTTKAAPRTTFDVNGFSSMSAAQQTQYLLDQGLID